MVKRLTSMDGNEAVAHVAYRLNEVCAIYPITPSSPMAEMADEWAAHGVPNLWGTIPVVQEMQSEGGAAGAIHGALQSGALTTTFTASQGLLLMIPNMFKIAGELTATVFHVAARTVATSATSIFCDHSDVMATRTTGFAMLCSGSVQEAHDSALIAQAATLQSRVPFLHFFDGFRTSHEVNTLELLADDQMRAMIDESWVRAHRARALDPEHPVVRGTVHNWDTYFQGREAVNPFYDNAPRIVDAVMDRFARLTGRRYRLFEYDGAADAERVIVLMGSAAETARAAAAALRARGEKVGVMQVRLYRPFAAGAFVAVLPKSARAIAVLDRTKEPGSAGEPLYLDVVSALARAVARGTLDTMPNVLGGRYGLASKEFDPGMVKAVFDELKHPAPRHGFTVGIRDDVTHTSLDGDVAFVIDSDDVIQAVFYGLGADGTVGANRNSAKIIAEEAGLYSQAYFVFDSHKSGAQTVSHLRFGPRPIRAPYLIQQASFVGVHQFHFLGRGDVLRLAAPGAVLLLNAPFGHDAVWDHIPRSAQQQIIDKNLRVFVIDASKVAEEVGLRGRTNTILQTCFFAISGVLPKEEAIRQVKHMIERTYGSKGAEVVRKNFQAVDETLARLFPVPVPAHATSRWDRPPIVPDSAPEFVRTVTAKLMAGLGDELPVSLLPADGTYPSGTAVWEKRNTADVVPEWEQDLCIQCGQCSFVCPHAVIRAKYFDAAKLHGAPDGFKSAPVNVRGFPGVHFSLQVYVEDCTGCGLCVEACPARSPVEPDVRALNLRDKLPLVDPARRDIAFFEALPVNDRARVDFANVRGVQFLEPLFEFSGACAGCGETPYLTVLSRLFGDRMMMANASGCSSVNGGNLPVTPWSKNREGRGPAWSNSLFEDNAEFGLGFRLAADKHLERATALAKALAPEVGVDLVDAVLTAPQHTESEIRAQRDRLAELTRRLTSLDGAPQVMDLLSVVDYFVRRSVWIVGGDGWAYDIGYGGLDHVLASGRDVNLLVLDTAVYSNTGGQASKATPLAATAKFADAGKRVARKDLALQAIAYGNVYVAQVAMGANPQQTLLAFREAETYPGTSLILAYCHCIAHGIDMRYGLRQQQMAVASGAWPLFRYNPAMRAVGQNPFRLDSARPTVLWRDYAYQELRYRALALSRPAEAEQLLDRAQAAITEKYRLYEEMTGWADGGAHPAGPSAGGGTTDDPVA